jgi:hypothetical protein
MMMIDGWVIANSSVSLRSRTCRQCQYWPVPVPSGPAHRPFQLRDAHQVVNYYFLQRPLPCWSALGRVRDQ